MLESRNIFQQNNAIIFQPTREKGTWSCTGEQSTLDMSNHLLSIVVGLPSAYTGISYLPGAQVCRLDQQHVKAVEIALRISQ